MAYIGNTVENQGFTPAIDYFNGDGVTVTFTLSRPIASVAQVIVAIDNVIQNPSSSFTVAGSAITFSSAPLSGTNNIWVEYTSLITTYQGISQDPTVIGDIRATGGYLAEGDFGNSFIDGNLIDYVTGAGRFTVGELDDLVFYHGGTSARSEIMRMSYAGNSYIVGRLGVGTTSPATKLNVVESGAADAVIRVSNNSGGVYASSLNVDSTNLTGSRYNSIYSSNNNTYQWAISGGGADATMSFGTGSSNTERMRIDSSGRVTTPYQPAFDAYGTAGNVLFTTDTPIAFTSTTFNVGSNYNTGTYRFTAPVAGIYFFRAQVYKQASGNASRLRLYKNAADVRVYQYISATDTYTFNITGIISLAVGDYVTCNFNSDGAGTNIYLADNHSNFSGYLLG